MNDKTVMKDATIKILAIVFAVLLWYYVVTEQNPMLTREVTVPVKLTNLDVLDKNNLALLENPLSFEVTLRLKGKKEVLDKVSDTSIAAYANLEGHKSIGANRVKIAVTGIPQGANLSYQSDEVIYVTIEPKISIQKPITVEITGNPAQGLAAMSAVIAPEEILVSGAESQIQRIKTVKVDVDIAGAAGHIKRILPVRVLGADGKDVQGIQYTPKSVEISIPVENTKRVPVQVDLSGKAASDYQVSFINVFPREVLITGTPEALNAIETIKTEKVDINNAIVDIDKNVTLVIPPGVELAEKSQTLRVYIEIEKVVSRQITIDNIEYKNVPAGLTIQSEPKGAVVVIRGAESLINDAPRNIKLYVDLRQGVEGSNTLNIMWEKPNDIEIVDLTPQQIEIVLEKVQ